MAAIGVESQNNRVLFAQPALGAAVLLTWTDNADNEDGFEIERSPDGSTGWAQIGSAGADATGFRDNHPVIGAMNYYRVRAVNMYGNSSYSGTASVSVP